MLSPEHATTGGLLAFVAGFVALEWFIHATAPVLKSIGLAWIPWHPAEKSIAHHAVAAVLPMLVLIVVVGGIFAYLHWRSSRAKPLPVGGEFTAARRAGLIAPLSTYSCRTSPYKNSGELARHAAATPSTALGPLGALRADVLRSNWGPLLAAVQHHQPTLRHCWLLCTPQARPMFADAVCVLELLAGGAVRFHAVDIDDPNSVASTATAVDRVYRTLAPEADLEESEVIADITSGNAVMSCAISRAVAARTWRHIEYLRQDTPLYDEATGVALTPGDIDRRSILVEVVYRRS